MEDFRNEIVIASMLHDIGKFFNDCGGGVIEGINTFKGNSDTHPITSYLFVNKYTNDLKRLGLDADVISDIVLWHHGAGNGADVVREHLGNINTVNSTLCNIVSKADGLSSNERLTKSKQATEFGGLYERKKRSEYLMSSIFNDEYKLLNIEDALESSSKNNKPSVEINKKAVKNFVIEFEETIKNSTTVAEFIEELDKVLYKYTTYTTSAANEKYNTVSLYYHLKTTAAFASVIYSYYLESGKFAKSSNYEFKVLRLYYENSDRFFKESNTETIKSLNKKINFAEQSLNRLINEILEISKVTILNKVIDKNFDKIIIVSKYDEEYINNIINTYIRKTWEQTDGNLELCVKQTDISTDDTYVYGGKNSWLSKLLDNKVLPDYSINKILTSGDMWNNLEIENDRYDFSVKKDEKPVFNSKFYAIVIIQTDKTIDENIKSVLSKNIKKYAVIDSVIIEEDKYYDITSISRYATAEKFLDYALSYKGNRNCITYKIRDKLLIISEFKDILPIVKEVKERFYKITSEKIELSANIKVFNHSINISSVYKALINSKDKYTQLMFNTVSYEWNEIDNLIDMLNTIKDCLCEKNKKSLAYRYIDTISNALEYTDDGDTYKLAYIGRLNKYIVRNKVKPDELTDYIKDQLSKIINNEIYDTVVYNLPELIKYIIEEEV